MNDPPVDRIRSIFVLVAANFAVFAAFWLLFELGLHIGWPNENPLLGPAFAKSKARIANSTFGHTLASNFAGEEFWGARSTKLFTNSLGFKDSTVRNVPLRSDRKRIVFIGDSFSEGIGAPYEETFVGRFAATFRTSTS